MNYRIYAFEFLLLLALQFKTTNKIGYVKTIGV